MSERRVIKIVLGLIKLFVYKIMFGKRLEIKSFRQNLCLDTEIYIGKKAFLSLGNVRCNSNLHLECYLGRMKIGNVSFNRYCIISCRYKIEIGDNCFFGPNVCVYDHDHVYTADGVSPSEYKCSEIIIEDGCWICAGAIILRGTHIGRNSVIQAGAIVKGNIPPNSLVEPARENRTIPTALFTGKHKEAAAHSY
jgi:acetyltransferase-like isoleucine patch superfamily enzyme